MDTAVLKEKLRSKKKIKTEREGRLSSGLTVVNLACSGKATWAFKVGHVYLFVGDSAAGKTWLEKTVFAEAAHSEDFRNYRLIDDNPERGSLMDIAKFFGMKTIDRLEAPGPKGSSRTLEQFYDNVKAAVRDGRPFIYGLDSEDALPPESEIKRSDANSRKRKKASEGQDVKMKGSMGMEKAKLNSSELRIAHNDLDRNGSMLFIIKQTRQNTGWNSQYNPKTRSGGDALTFYNSLELWFSVKGKLRKKVKGKERVQGSVLKIHVKKNRMSGRDRTVLVHFYPTHGFDETGTNCEFLCEEGHWSRDKDGIITAPEFEFKGDIESLVHHIEDNGKERQLRLLVASVWNEIEQELTVVRKPRYS